MDTVSTLIPHLLSLLGLALLTALSSGYGPGRVVGQGETVRSDTVQSIEFSIRWICLLPLLAAPSPAASPFLSTLSPAGPPLLPAEVRGESPELRVLHPALLPALPRSVPSLLGLQARQPTGCHLSNNCCRNYVTRHQQSVIFNAVIIRTYQNCTVVLDNMYTIEYKEECGRRYEKVVVIRDRKV